LLVLSAFAVPAAVAALVIPSARPADEAATRYCTREAGWVADGTLQVLHHYDHDVYPADVALIGLQTSVQQFRLHRCPNAVLRQAMLRKVTPKQRARLLEILPRGLAQYFRRVLAG
jgi:hypothetical protein